MADNIAEIIAQAEALGLLGVTASKLIPGRWLRFRVEGCSQQDAGRIKVSEVTLANGRRVYIGNIGVYRGADYKYEKIDLGSNKDKYGSTADERKAIAARNKEQQAKAEAADRAKAERAALLAEKKYHACRPAEPATALYLREKGVQAHDVRQTNDGAVVIPMRAAGRIVALQIILSKKIAAHKRIIEKFKGENKRFWPPGCKTSGAFHWIGGIPRPGDVIIVSEGYSTSATVREATGLICVVAISAGNIKPVVEYIAERYPDVYIAIAADDDDLRQCPNQDCRHRFMLSQLSELRLCPECGQPHGRKNDGVKAAIKACGGTDSKRVSYTIPRWSDNARRLHAWVKHGNKRTDFNDLMIDEGEAAVRLQFERYIADLRLGLPSHAPPVVNLPCNADMEKPKYMVTDLPTALWRWALIADGDSTVYDQLLRKIVKKQDALAQMVGRDLRQRWQDADEPDKKVITMDDIGLFFDEKDRDKPGNGWQGFATKGVCHPEIQETLIGYVREVICSDDPVRFDFLMKCLAFPIQHPGKRIHIGVILVSEEGLGKDTFGQLFLRPFGRHGIMLSQIDLEDRFNPHMENILACIFQELGASRQTSLHSLKNLVKQLITSDTIRLNPKQVNGRMVPNLASFMFFTNEVLPFLLGHQGRRFLVLRLKTKKPKEFYKAINDLIKSDQGGNAWHCVLETYDLNGFTGYEDAPLTEEKTEMLMLSLPPALQFWMEFVAGDLSGIPNTTPIISQDLYDLFLIWCKKSGYRVPDPRNKFVAEIKGQPEVRIARFKCTLQLETTINGSASYQNTDLGQPIFILPPKCQEIPYRDKAVTLGRWVLAFRAAMEDYK